MSSNLPNEVALKPKVTVVMPAFNAQNFICEAIESILNQTYTNFIFLIINDGSTDETEKIIESYRDPRIQLIKNETNIGLISSLNRCIELVTTDYIVRFDADDISLPKRIEMQVQFMDQHPNVVLSGTNVHYFGEFDYDTNYPTTSSDQKALLLFSSGIAHPSAIIRTSVLHQNKLFYNKNYYLIEDHELWTELSKYGDIAILPNVLLHYRWNGQNITSTNWSSRDKKYSLIHSKLLRQLEIEPTPENLRLHRELSYNADEIKSIKTIFHYAKKIIEQNNRLKHYDQIALKKLINQYKKQLFYKCVSMGSKMVWQYWFSAGPFRFYQIKYLFGYRLKRINQTKLDTSKNKTD